MFFQGDLFDGLKHGSQVIEEDIVFPCPKPPKSAVDEDMRTSTPTPQSISYQGDLSSNPRTDEHHMTNNGLYPDREFDPTQDTPPKKAGHPSNRHSVDVQASLKRDHSILKKSYDAIFQNSFINPQVLTILPFYLQTTFPNMTLSFPVVNMYIPSPSVPDRCLQRTYATFRHSSDSVTLVDDPSTIFSAVRNDHATMKATEKCTES